jgi:hypothetical protein
MKPVVIGKPLTVGLSLVLLAGLHLPARAELEGVALPETHAGSCAAAYFSAFNAGENEMRAFEPRWRAKSALAARSIDDRMTQYRDLRGRWGKLTPRSVLQSAERSISVLVNQEATGEDFEFAFEFEPDSPYGMTAIKIMGPVSAESAVAAGARLDAGSRGEIVEQVARALAEAYVFPEMGAKLAESLRAALAKGEYDSLTEAGPLAERLTSDLQGLCKDKHLRMRPGKPRGEDDVFDPDRDRRDNYAFRKVELLPGNIGYIKFDLFNPSEPAKAAAAAALAFVQNCDALIFDLRENGGGSPEMINFISSYLFEEPTHLNSFYDRLSNKTSESWTSKQVPGKRFAADLPVYVLTSHYTFSGAEEFSYNLKNLKRATIVGETTGGGAHPVTARRIADGFTLMVPYARAENPITKTTWEGVGVKPDIETTAEKALDVALEDARKRTAERRSRS